MKKIKSVLIMTLLVASVFMVLSPVSASCPTVVINELNTDDGDDWLELYNYGPAINMSGWTFTWEDDGQGPGTFTFPNGFILGSKKFVLIQEWDDEEGDPIPPNTESILYFDENIGWSDNEENTARLLDKNGNCVDYVRMESSNVDVDNPTPANCSWGPPNITDTGPFSYVFRNSDIDTNTGNDWTKSNDGTPLAFNPGQTGKSPCNSKALPMDWIMKKFGLGKEK